MLKNPVKPYKYWVCEVKTILFNPNYYTFCDIIKI